MELTRFNIETTIIINNIEIANYVDNNTPYVPVDDIDDLIKLVEEASGALF